MGLTRGHGRRNMNRLRVHPCQVSGAAPCGESSPRLRAITNPVLVFLLAGNVCPEASMCRGRVFEVSSVSQVSLCIVPLWRT